VLDSQAPGDGDDLPRGLALTQDGFRHTVAERAVEIDPREAEVLNRQRPEAPERLIWRDGPSGDRLEQLPYFFPIHLRASFALPLRNPWRSTVT
jgi:hypothetical protein